MSSVVASGIALALTLPGSGATDPKESHNEAPASTIIHVSYVVSPHPDDEFQGWSLVEQSPDNYKVFIVLTHGEQSGYCEPDGYARSYQPGLERPATPEPRGRWSPECGKARITAQVNYLNDMALGDSTLPGDLQYQGVRAPFPSNGVDVCRRDSLGTDGPCTFRDRTARVWTSPNGMGALIMFNLGDGDLTTQEVTWAITTVQQNRAALGLNSTLSERNIIGASYRNASYPGCIRYDHVDHQSVHRALRNVDFGVGQQWGATCASDPDASRHRSVSAAGVTDAFEVGANGQRLGAHVNNYGWLESPYYRIDVNGQAELFHRQQSFWLAPVNS